MRRERSERQFYVHIDTVTPARNQTQREVDACTENFMAVAAINTEKGKSAYDLFDAVMRIQNHLSYDVFGNVLIRSDSEAIADENAFILLCDKFGTLQKILYFHITADPLTASQKDLQDRMSRLCEMSIEIHDISEKHVEYDTEKYKDRWEKVSALEVVYQDLFSETVRKFG